MGTAIWWIRRDLRLHDNRSLSYAIHHYDKIIPLFILDPVLISDPPSRRDLFLFDALSSLDKSLRQKSTRLIVRKGKPLTVFEELWNSLEIDAIVAERDFSPYARKRDESVGRILPLTLIDALTIHPPEAISKSDGKPYSIFTPFSRKWKALPYYSNPSPKPGQLSAVPDKITSLTLPSGSSSGSFPANENAAQKKFTSFLDNLLFDYKENRNLPAIDGTSQLSVYFKFGLLSIHEAVFRVREIITSLDNPIDRENCSAWLNQLIWREFYFSILFHFPGVITNSFRPNFQHIHWANDQSALRAWQQGLTGFPIVDAGMRQLNHTGWMHNRARMITASFLVKDLLINWQEGEKWFMQHLIDGDVASNNGGWQWVAGTGTDAAPYFRIFNPVLQSRKFDPDGDYIRRWVPEIAHLDSRIIHAPSESPDLKVNYPKPIINHQFARERALLAYKTARQSAG